MTEVITITHFIPAKPEHVKYIITDLEEANIFEFWTIFFEEVRVRDQ